MKTRNCIIFFSVSIIFCFLGAAAFAMPDETEVAIGRGVNEKIIKRYGVLENPDIQKYVEHVGLKLVSVCGRQDIVYHFIALKSDKIDASCAPGGYVYVTKGLLANIESEAELAAALADEIAHIAGRHGIKWIEMNMEFDPNGKKIFQKQARIERGAELAYDFVRFGYGKRLQTEADIKAAEYILWAGYDASAMIKFLDILQVEEKTHPEMVAGLLKTRPKTTKRIDRVRLMLDSLKTSHPDRYNSAIGNLYAERYKEEVIDALNRGGAK